MKLISVFTPCYNEEENVDELYQRVKAVFDGLPQYKYEHLFIDNASTDQTVARLKAIAANDPKVKIIVNLKNFGQVRSPYYAMMQCQGRRGDRHRSRPARPARAYPDLHPEMGRRLPGSHGGKDPK